MKSTVRKNVNLPRATVKMIMKLWRQFCPDWRTASFELSSERGEQSLHIIGTGGFYSVAAPVCLDGTAVIMSDGKNQKMLFFERDDSTFSNGIQVFAN